MKKLLLIIVMLSLSKLLSAQVVIPEKPLTAITAITEVKITGGVWQRLILLNGKYELDMFDASPLELFFGEADEITEKDTIRYLYKNLGLIIVLEQRIDRWTNTKKERIVEFTLTNQFGFAPPISLGGKLSFASTHTDFINSGWFEFPFIDKDTIITWSARGGPSEIYVFDDNGHLTAITYIMASIDELEVRFTNKGFTYIREQIANGFYDD